MSKLLDGAWEETGVIGTRLEIQGHTLTVLWRNAPVLVTHFTEKPAPDGVTLLLKQNGMRYENDSRDFAALTCLCLRDGHLFMEETFPISGASRKTLSKTARSRYGNVTVADRQILPRLSGQWTDEKEFWTLTFSGDRMTFAGKTVRVCAVQNNAPPHEIRVIDRDPSRCDFGGITFLTVSDDRLTAQEIIFDAPPHTLTFHKI